MKFLCWIGSHDYNKAIFVRENSYYWENATMPNREERVYTQTCKHFREAEVQL